MMASDEVYGDGEWQVSCLRFTASCVVERAHIVSAAPIIRRFVGQPFANLLNWAGTLGGLRVHPIGATREGTPDGD